MGKVLPKQTAATIMLHSVNLAPTAKHAWSDLLALRFEETFHSVICNPTIPDCFEICSNYSGSTPMGQKFEILEYVVFQMSRYARDFPDQKLLSNTRIGKVRLCACLRDHDLGHALEGQASACTCLDSLHCDTLVRKHLHAPLQN